MKVLITGSNGFVAQNLISTLEERKDVEILRFTRDDDVSRLDELTGQADFIFHLAGVNRPKDPADFKSGNAGLTQQLCDSIARGGRRTPVIYSSSTQASQDNPYGLSKREAEDALSALAEQHGSPVYLFRLPNVFGKWARPNYNSAVATFCHNINRGLPIQINDPTAAITLVYVDDVVARFIELMDARSRTIGTAPSRRSTASPSAISPRSWKRSATAGRR